MLLIPTVHLGVAAFQMEKRGIRTERGNLNREIEITNRNLRQLKARISKLQNWLKEEAANTEPPTLADVIQGILLKQEQTGKQSRYTTIHNLKAAANMLNFLTANGIKDMAGLEERVMDMYGEQRSISEKLKSTDRRLKTLDEHLRHSGNYKAYRRYKAQYEKLYAQYRQIKKAGGFGAERKAQKALDTANAYHNDHHKEIVLFESAEKYLKDVMQERFDPKKLPPIRKWEAERDKLKVERQQLSHRYSTLKDEVKEAEQIRRNVHSILKEERGRELPKRKHDLER